MEIKETCYIVGGGASLRSFDWKDLDGKYVIAINRAYEVLPNANVIYFTDNDWWEKGRNDTGQLHRDALLQHPARKIKGSLGNSKINHPQVEEYTFTDVKGYDKTPGNLCHGYNSTYAAINLAVAHLGFKRVYLLGVDMKWGQRGNKHSSHWHSGYTKTGENEAGYHQMMSAFPTILPMLKEYNAQVFNVNPDSALITFPKLSLWDLFGDKYKQVTPQVYPKPNYVVAQPKPQPKQLLGDKVEQALARVGAKKVARVYQRITGKPCNCGRRKQLLNTIHQRIIGDPTIPRK